MLLLLPAKRSFTIGSLTLDASLSVPWIAIRTVRLCVQLVCTALHISNEFVSVCNPSDTCTSCSGPEAASEALNARCTVPRCPLQPCPFVQSAPPFDPLVSPQSSVTGRPPCPGVTVSAGLVQRPVVESYVSFVPLFGPPGMNAVRVAPYVVTGLAAGPKSTFACSTAVHAAVEESK